MALSPRTIAVQLRSNRPSTPGDNWAWQANKLTVKLTLPSDETFDGVDEAWCELHTAEYPTEEIPLANVVLTSPTDGVVEFEFTGDQMNQTMTAKATVFWLVAFTVTGSDAPEVLWTSKLTLKAHNASQTAGNPPVPARAISLTYADARYRRLGVDIAQADITGLTLALAGKAATSHTHVMANITDLAAALVLLAPLASPGFTGIPTAPTATLGTNTTQIATTAFVLANASAGVTDHGALTGLGDDDHTQYLNNARGDARYTVLAHASNTSNPHSVTKTQVGLGNADNTSDANKPVSSATQTALNLKANLTGATFSGTVQATQFNLEISHYFEDSVWDYENATATAGHRAALGLGALATLTPGAGIDTALALAVNAAGGLVNKAYADALVTGLLDDRGNYNASGNTFPASGGSGTAGAILKGDLWTVSVSGTLGGVAVTAGDLVRAVTDTPGQTAGNWALSENNLGYTPVNSAGTLALAGFAAITGTLPVANTAALTGDVTKSAGSSATSIAAGVVTNAMLAGGIAFSKLVGSDITTVGTLAAGAIPTTLLTGTITNAQLAGSIDLTAKVAGVLPVANGGRDNTFILLAAMGG